LLGVAISGSQLKEEVFGLFLMDTIGGGDAIGDASPILQ